MIIGSDSDTDSDSDSDFVEIRRHLGNKIKKCFFILYFTRFALILRENWDYAVKNQ